MIEKARTITAQVPALEGKAVTVSPLGGGLTNHNFRLDADGESFVLRIGGMGTDLLGIDREREVACSRAAADSGVGPEVIAWLPQWQALVTRFLPGRLLNEEDGRRPEILRRLAASLRCYHDYRVPADLARFSPFETVRSYHALARDKCVPLPGNLSGAIMLLARFEKELVTGEPLCLCHNDLLAANCIDQGSAIRLIDWEYAGLGDRFFDLGNFAVNYQLDEHLECVLLEAYFGVVRPEHTRRLHLMRLASDMREALWGFLQAGISTLCSPDYYLDYGTRHLGRFLAAGERLA